MHIFEVATKVAALSESLPAFGAGERPLSSVLSEVITKVTAFFEDRTTTAMSTFEVKLDSHGLGVAYFYGLVPVAGDAFECFRLKPEQGCLRGGFLGFLTLLDVMGQKFCFFFQTAFVGLLRLIS